MAGISKLAYKLLVNDRAKFTALLVGITFAVFLMIQMLSLFAGILSRSSATVLNVGASMWVMDPAVQTVPSSIGMPDYVLDDVRSIDGVNYAVPSYSGGALVKLSDGTYQAVTVLGPMHVRCYVDEILVPRLPDPAKMKAQMSIRGSPVKVSLEYVSTQPIVSPKIELSNQRLERVDVRVLPIIFRWKQPVQLTLYPGQLVDVYIGEIGE